MLVLSRKRGEAIRVEYPDGTVVRVVVLANNGNRVKFGITACEDVRVRREELPMDSKVEILEIGKNRRMDPYQV